MAHGLGLTRGFDKSKAKQGKSAYFLSVRQPDGTRPKHYFSDAKDRDREYNKRLTEIRKHGVGAVGEVSAADRQAISEMNRLAEPTGLTPLEIFNRGLAQLGHGVTIQKLTVGQAHSLFIAEQNQRLTDGKISAVRLKEIRNRVGAFVKVWSKKPIALCTRAAVKLFLASLDVSPQSRVNYARNLSFFFNWCVAEGIMDKNPVPEQEGVDRIPKVFTNAQVWELFAKARDGYPSLVPMLAIQWFAGLRPGATHHLLWQDIDFERRRFLIQPHGNKLRQPDIVEDVPLTVFGMLLPYRKDSGPVADPNHIELNKCLHWDLGYTGNRLTDPKRWPEDVARHTFASNLVALYEQDLKRVRAVLLHSTNQMLLKHYLLKNIPLAAAVEYFGHHLPLVVEQ